MARTGEIGEQTWQRINELTSQQGMPRNQAFDVVAEETGKQPGTVSAAFYRVERKRNGPSRGSGRRSSSGTRSRSTSGATTGQAGLSGTSGTSQSQLQEQQLGQLTSGQQWSAQSQRGGVMSRLTHIEAEARKIRELLG